MQSLIHAKPSLYQLGFTSSPNRNISYISQYSLPNLNVAHPKNLNYLTVTD
jgi:hypothetical protein